MSTVKRADSTPDDKTGSECEALITYACNPTPENQKENHSKWGRNPDTWMVGLTGLLMLIGLVTGVIFYRQFREMSKQTGILSQQAEDAGSDARSARRIARQQRRDSEARLIAETRPWIVLNTDPGQSFASGRQVTVNVEAKNIGHSPATRISKTDIHFRILEAGPKLVSFVKTFSIAPVPQSPGVALAPNDTMTNTYFGDILTPEQASRLLTLRIDVILVYARIDYSGPLGSENYYTETCRLYNPIGLPWSSCVYHNEMQ